MDSLLDWMRQLAGESHVWIAEVFIVVLLALLVELMLSRFIRTLSARAKGSLSHWDDVFFDSISAPVRWLVWLVGLSFAAEIAAKQTSSNISSVVSGIRYVGVIVIITWFLVGFVSRAEKQLILPRERGKPMDPTTAMAVGKLVRIAILITAVLVTMQSLGYSISGLLAFGGIGGIAVGFAAKDLLANFFGGLMIYLDRPFVVGDWVRSPDKNIEGTVEDIGWRLTRIRTFDKRPLYVPNSTFTQISVENPSRMSNRRIYETLGIRYVDASKMAAVISGVQRMIESHADIDTSQTIIVNFNKFAASSLEFFVYCFTKTTNWVEYHKIKQDVLLQIIEIVESNDAECAFPTSTLHFAEALKLEQPAVEH